MFHFSLVLVLLLPFTAASCYDPSPAFPPPPWKANQLAPAFHTIQTKLEDLIADEKYDASSFSLEVTSNTESLWSNFHTARKLNSTRPGVKHVEGDSLYRIASITKTFTVLGLLYQHEAGNLSLDSPISKYIPELGGEIPWKDITLRILASQLSGIPRDFAQGDLVNELPDPTVFGLPPATKESGPACDEYNDYVPCNGTDLLDWLDTAKPLFAPNQKSTYSNLNFELLGLALERATGMSYKDYMRTAIFEPLKMTSTSLDTPPDTHAVLPFGGNYWDVDGGVQNPTGGIYSSAMDMSKFVRYILTHYNALATGVNWMMPASWAGGLQSFYGMPFEIFRTDKILKESRRPVTFVTKAGGLQAYYSRITMMPEYGLGLTLLIGGDDDLLGKIQEIVTVALVQEAEDVAWAHMENTFTGLYTAIDSALNSSLELTTSPSSGLVASSFISNGTDILHDTLPGRLVDDSHPWHLQLVPTLLYKNESAQQGVVFRMIPVQKREDGVDRGVWDAFCSTDDDPMRYAGLPLNEVVFWHEEGVVELPAWRLKMKAAKKEDTKTGLVVQS